LLQCGRIIDTIASHCSDFANLLQYPAAFWVVSDQLWSAMEAIQLETGYVGLTQVWCS
jgi:hypothetical protein